MPTSRQEGSLVDTHTAPRAGSARPPAPRVLPGNPDTNLRDGEEAESGGNSPGAQRQRCQGDWPWVAAGGGGRGQVEAVVRERRERKETPEMEKQWLRF